MELEPKYVDVIIARWEKFTGEIHRGDELMSFGLHAPTTLEYRSILWILDKV